MFDFLKIKYISSHIYRLPICLLYCPSFSEYFMYCICHQDKLILQCYEITATVEKATYYIVLLILFNLEVRLRYRKMVQRVINCICSTSIIIMYVHHIS